MARGSSRLSPAVGLAPVFAALLFGVPQCFGAQTRPQSRGVPYDPDFGPGFYETSLDREYPDSYERIEAVDFRNLRLYIVDETKRVLTRAKLKNGSYDSTDQGTWDSVKLDSIYYLPSENSHRQFALVLYTWVSAGGSSNTDGVAQIYELQSGRLKSVQQLEWDEHFETDHPYVSFNEKSHTLRVRSAHYLPGDAHCCISAVDVVTLQWNGNLFVKKVVWVELSKSGEKTGKKL